MNKPLTLLLILSLIGVPMPINSSNQPIERIEFKNNLEINNFQLISDTHDDIFDPSIHEIIISASAIDPDGNIWVGGILSIGSNIFVQEDVFLSKLSPQGDILWTKYYNGNRTETALNSINFDSQGNVIIGFQTSSRDHPSSPYLSNGSEYDQYLDTFDLYIEKMDLDGETIWSRYIGGIGFDCCVAILLDEVDNLFVSSWTQFPGPQTINSWLNDTYQNNGDSLFAKLNPNGEIEWLTLYGGFYGGDAVMSSTNREAYHGNGLFTFTGWSSSSDFPITMNGNPHNASGDLSLVEVNTTSKEIIFSSLYGGNNFDTGSDLFISEAGDIYVFGTASSPDFPVLNAMNGTYLGGADDAIIMKLDQNKNLLWSTFYGGNHADGAYDGYLDSNQKLVVLGDTKSSNFNTTDNSSPIGDYDIFISRIEPDGSEVLQSTLIGGSGTDNIYNEGFNRYDHNFIFGTTTNLTFYSKGELISDSLKTYPFSFGGVQHGFGIELQPNTFQVLNFITAVVVPEPDEDYDNDGLTNQEEYELYRDAGIEVDPLNPDTDGDGLPDGWEVLYGLTPDDPIVNSGSDDTYDGDGLNNAQEFEFDTSPQNSDSDGDGMDDKYEYDHGLVGNRNDASEDKDQDEMINLYEYQYGFNASNSADGNEDPDDDRAVNTVEFREGTDPYLEDTDGDGYTDGYELANGMNPLRDDRKWDADHDGIPNWIEAEYWLNPGSSIDGYLIWGSLIFMVTTFTFLFIRSKKRNSQAKEEGFEDYSHKKQITKAGYQTVEEFEIAKKDGFVNKIAHTLISELSYKSSGEFITGLDHFISETNQMYSKQSVERQINLIKSTFTPITLSQNKLGYNQFHEGITSKITMVNDLIRSQETILELYKKEDEVLVGLKAEDLSSNQSQLIRLRVRLNEYVNNLEQALHEKEQWLVPWNGMFKLIQITEDNAPIPITDIMEVVNITEEHAIKLITELLKENPQFGSYDPETKIYRKSKQAMISDYLEKAMRALEDIQE